MSDDGSDDIYKMYDKVIVDKYNTSKILDFDVIDHDIKKCNDYKQSLGTADWVIVCDADEIIYHNNLPLILDKYKKNGIQIPKIKGYILVGTKFGDIYKDDLLNLNMVYQLRFILLNFTILKINSNPIRSAMPLSGQVSRLILPAKLQKKFQ